MWILNKHPQAEGNLAKHQDIRMLTVTQHGMCGDGVSNDTAAIQAAIDAAAAHGGGTVVVPPGRYRVGTVFLRDRIRLHLEAGIGCRERRGTRRGPARGRRQHQSPPGDPACPRAGSRSLARFGTRRMRAGDVSVTEHECETVGCSEQMPADQLHGFWKEMSDRGGMLQRAERASLDVQSRAVLAYVSRGPDTWGSVEVLEPSAIQELDDLIATYDADRPATAA